MMALALIIAVVVAILFIILWSEERERAEKAEAKVKQLTRQLNKHKKKPKEALQVTARPKKRVDYTIPKSTQQVFSQVKQREDQKPETFVLDQNKLAELKAQTREAQELLADIFVQDEEEVQPQEVTADGALLERLFARDVWQRDEVLGMLEPGAMLGSVLERLNDYAYEKVGDVVVEEDGDNIYVMTEYKDQLI